MDFLSNPIFVLSLWLDVFLALLFVVRWANGNLQLPEIRLPQARRQVRQTRYEEPISIELLRRIGRCGNAVPCWQHRVLKRWLQSLNGTKIRTQADLVRAVYQAPPGMQVLLRSILAIEGLMAPRPAPGLRPAFAYA